MEKLIDQQQENPSEQSKWDIQEPELPAESESQKKSERIPKEPEFPDDPDQYTEEELKADPSKRFHVNPADFPFFSQQAEKGPRWGDPSETLPLDYTLGRFVQSTADTIAVLAGEDCDEFKDEDIPAADHIVYLDKSARPVCWLVNTFWKDFTDKPRPKHSFLAIDRREWFARTNTPIEANEYIRNEDGSARLARFSDFRTENVTDEDIARIRSLFIPGGIETEDPAEIMQTPTGLEGKNITIVDEVSRSGSTLAISKYLLSRAIPEAASVNGYTFWDAGAQISSDGSERQMRGVPVWYDPKTHYGRGIGDVNESFFAERHEHFNTPKTRAQKFGAIVLGQFIDLGEEPGNRSRELAREIRTMHKEWEEDHILMRMPMHYDQEKWRKHITDDLHMPILRQERPAPGRMAPKYPKNSLNYVREEIASREPVPPHSF
ncbi:hypothetical protein IJM16_04650 [Candidatus Saccharibacteria bacterium]|nr:hypothetical protein [Candidatus Saccharibacteria bacterium]